MQKADKVFRYWPKNKPVPEGWVKRNAFDDCHHGYHSVLIECIDEENIARAKKDEDRAPDSVAGAVPSRTPISS